MKNLSFLWKAMLVLFTLTTSILVVNLGWKEYDKRTGVFPGDYGFNGKFGKIMYHDGKYVLFSYGTNTITTPKLDWVAEPGKKDSFVVFSQDNKRGYIDVSTGEIIIPAQFDLAWNFSEGVGGVVTNNRVSFINLKQEKIGKNSFSYFGERDNYLDYVFNGGYCTAMDSTKKQGLINKNGEWALPPTYDYINKPLLAYRIIKEKNKYGLLDKDLRLILPPEYNHIVIEKAGLKLAKDGTQQLWSFDLKTILQPFVYDEVNYIKYGTGQYDANGDEIEKNSNYLAYCIFTKWGIMSPKGKVITPAIYEHIYGLSADSFTASIESHKITLNPDGNTVH